MKYVCDRCGYHSNHKCNFGNHLNRKKICCPLLEDISIDEIKFKYGFEISSKNPQKSSKSPQNSSNITPQKSSKNPQKSSFFPQKSSKILKKSHNKECLYCGKEFSRIDNFKRHLTTCKKKIEFEQLAIESKDKELEEKEKKIKELEEKIKYKGNTNIINTTNNNINNSRNIIINNYGDENIKHLRSKDYASLLTGIYSAVPKLIQQIHFDPEHPENHNIKFTNKKLPYLKVMKGDKWQLVDKKTELLDLIDNKCYLLREKYYNILEKNKYNITDNQKNIIDKFLDKYEEDDKQVLLDIINKTELVLINNS
jgi:hypothetical protein